MTFKEYLVESALLEYSDEYFKVCQECYEISLSEQYLRNQMIMNESVASVGLSMEEIGDVQLESTFFTEAASDEDLVAMYEGVKEKASHAWNWVVQKVKNAIATFANWLLKVAGKSSEQEAVINELKMTLTKTQFDNQDAQEAIEAFKKEIASYQSQLKEAGIQIENSKEELKAALASHAKETSDLKKEKDATSFHLNQEKEKNKDLQNQNENLRKARAADKDAIANLTKEGKAKQAEIDRLQKEKQADGAKISSLYDIIDEQTAQILALHVEANSLKVKFTKLPMFCDPAVLCRAMSMLVDMIESGNGKASTANTIYSAIEKSVNENHNKAIVINFSSKEFNGLAEQLKKAGDKLAKYSPENGGSMNQNIHGEDYTAITKTVAYVMKVHGQTMSAINAYASMKNKSIAPFKSLNSKLKKKISA